VWIAALALADVDAGRRLAGALLEWADQGVLLYFLALNSFYLLLLLLSAPELRTNWLLARREHLGRLLGTEMLPPLSVLAPAHNEEVTVVASVLSFLTLEYPHHEVVLVNDGSTDATLERLIAAYDLYEVPPAFEQLVPTQPVRAYYRSRRWSRLLVVDKANGGKADALNAGLNAARHPYVLAVDADTLVEPDALLRLGRPFLLGDKVAAVAGTVRVVNACTVAHGRVVAAHVDRRLLPGIQAVEYLRAFLFGRLGWNRLGGNLVISGAFGVFRREYLVGMGGYRAGSVAEDMELVVRLHRYLHERGIEATLPFIPDPVAWTEVPSSRRVLSLQRERWHRGLAQTLWQHRDMLCNPRYGRVGMLAFPFYCFGELLAPLVELLGWVLLAAGLLLDVVDRQYAVLFFAVAYGYGVLLSLLAILLEELTFRRYASLGDVVRLVGYALLEPLGYRQLTVVDRLRGLWRFLRRDERWGRMQREGFASTPAPAAASRLAAPALAATLAATPPSA
jgi:cellulose synthase/poly-beta-1,6-N-acetylglucosamine synthase-like glycosyltransferase